jgi:glycosyltransferase involved in cell wall biosynthesis
LVVDDGSVDGTGELVRTAGASDPRLRLIQQSHGGIVAALQAGLAAARGEFIARMDADDTMHPERLAAQVAWLDQPEQQSIGLVGCLVEFGGDRAASGGYALHVDWMNSIVTPDAIARHRFIESPLAHPSVMFRRELVERFGGYRAGDFPEDYELWLRWLDAGVAMAKVPQVLLRWADPPGRLSRSDPRYRPEAFFRLKAIWIAREVARVAAHRAIWIWGAGRHTRRRAAHLANHGVQVAGYIDVDAKKTGRGLGGTGLPVVAPEAIPAPGNIFVLSYVSSRGARDYNRAQLLARGYVEGRDFLLCA